MISIPKRSRANISRDRTPLTAYTVPCPVSSCGARIGEPCAPASLTHWARIAEAKLKQAGASR